MKTHFQKQSSLFARWLQTVFVVVLAIAGQATAQSPGGVSANLRAWYKADNGTSSTADGGAIATWQDKSGGGRNATQATAARQPKYYSNAMNFNPVVRFNLSSIGGATLGRSILPATNSAVTTFAASICNRATSGYNTITSFGGAADQPSDQVYNGIFRTYVDGMSPIFSDHPDAFPFETVATYSVYPNVIGRADGRKFGYNGLGNMQLPNITNSDFLAANNSQFSIGSERPDNTVEDFLGDIPEVIIYDRELTNAEVQKVQSYITLKYGITMDGLTDYLNSAGVIVWPKTTTFGKNIFGIINDNTSGLDQRVSKSVNANTILTMSTTKDYTSANADAARTSLVDGQSLIVGDNGVDPTLYSTFALSCGGITGSVKLNTVWQARNTNSVGSVFFTANLSGSGINDQPFMLIGTSSTFGAGTYRKVDGIINADGTATFAVKLKTGEFFTFGGVRGAGVCTKCYNGFGTLEWNKTPFWPIPTATNTAVARTLGTGQNLSIIFNDPQGVEYAKNVRPIRYGKTLLLDRWDNFTPTGTPNGGAYTGVFTLDKASMVRFTIHAVDRWAMDCKDIVEVRGYCGTTLITPKLSYTLAPDKSSYTIAGNIATGNNKWSGYFNKSGMVNIDFDRAVERVEIIWKSTKGGAPKRFQRIGLSNMVFECPAADPCLNNDDNVTFVKRIADGVSALKTCENIRFEYKLKNQTCVDKVVNISDVLPAGMAWITNGYEGGSYGGTPNTYAGTTTLSVASITIPAGASVSLFATAKFTNTAGTGYANRATMTVNGGVAGTISSGCSNTTWSTTAATPAPVPAITYAVDKTCYAQNQVATFTVTLNNTSGATISGAEFQAGLQGGFALVGSSVSTTLGGTVTLNDLGTYDGMENLEITGMSIPTGTSTFTFKANSGLSDSTYVMTATISADPNSDCATESSQSANITIAPCPPCTAGSTAPIITPTTVSNTCPSITYNLGSLANTGTKPAGTTLVWSTSKTPASTDTLSNLNVGAGKYYALYRDKTNACFSTGADSVTVTIGLCVNSPVTTPGLGSIVNGNAGTELAPTGGTAPYTYSNGSTDPLCVAPAGYTALPASSNLTITNASTGAYTYTAPSVPGNYYYCIKVCDSSTPQKCTVGVYKVNISGALPSLTTPAVKTPLPGGTDTGNAGTELNPQGGTAPYTYSNGSTDPLCVAPAGYTALPASSNLTVNSTTGAYTYTAPTTAGKYYFCIKVCDSATPQNCNVATYKIENTPTFGSTPPVINIPPGTPGTGGPDLNPSGGTQPYVYSNGSNEAGCIAPAAGYTLLPASSNLVVNSSTGVYTYTSPSTPGNYFFCIKVCDSSVPAKCNLATYKMTVGASSNGFITAKVMLQGAVSGTAMTTTLNTGNLIPTTDPYGKGATTTSTILSSNSVTDWVLVELRSAPGTVVESIAALVKNDGSIINPDGSTPLKFTTTSGNFYVAVRHRNHLGVMTATAIAISSTAQSIDFTSASTATYGTNAQATVGGGTLKAMWGGNAKGITIAGTDKVNYTGLGSSLSGIKTAIGSNLSLQVPGYLNADINLDGKVSYTGLGSDLSILKATLNSAAGGLNNIWNQTF